MKGLLVMKGLESDHTPVTNITVTPTEFAFAVTSPVCDTVAIASLSELHVSLLFAAFAGRTVGVIVSDGESKRNGNNYSHRRRWFRRGRNRESDSQ